MTTNGLEVAVIGMAGRFPDAESVDQFWQNLKNGVESIHPLTDEFLRQQGVPQTDLQHPQYVKAEAVLPNIDLFDADFFGFNPREAEILDPQQRLFLECAWEALETAGYDPQRYHGAVAVYAGSAINSYSFNLYTNPQSRLLDNYQLFLASDKDFLTTRVSYKLNLTGPSVDIQTACSTSLVAVHIACQSLLSGECDMALAGGVAISQPKGYLYQEGGIYSPDGHCRAFDAKAQGTVAGSGLGIVVLKRLEDAVADGDSIYALIKGSAINNDGASKVSYTAPSIDAQASVIRAALTMAEVEPETISYIEAHGTGTALGDPIEIAALTQVFGANSQHCKIGSVKTNIGHLDTAAGIASFIKTVLVLKHKQIPPSLHFKQFNSQIPHDRPFEVNTTLSEWHAHSFPRRAGVSSFGIGGTNAHIILEEAPEEGQGSQCVAEVSSVVATGVGIAGGLNHRRAEVQGKYQLLVVSAKTHSALETATANLVNHLRQHPDVNLADVAYTLQVGRQAFAYRRFCVCSSLEEASEVSAYAEATVPQHGTPAITFMFPGQGSQYVGMGRELYAEAVFRSHIDRCCELLAPHLGINLWDLVQSSTNLNDTAYAQPALFMIEYALAQSLMNWGIRPEAMIGHSIGEYVAATLAEVFSLEDALKLVAIRGRLMQQQPTGSMLSVFLSAKQIQPWLSAEIALAASNAPNLCVVSGNPTAIAQLEQRLSDAGISYGRLHTSHAFHSPMMSPVQAEFIEVMKSVKLNPPKIPYISNITGTWITNEQATDLAYWGKHLRETVQFDAGITTLTQQPRILLEVGPGNTLSTLAATHRPISTLRHPQANDSDIAFLLNAIGKLWLSGVGINWDNFWHERRKRIALPTYPFERQRYWIEPQPDSVINDRNWLYVPFWQRDRTIASVDLNTVEKSCWLIFIDAEGLGNSIAQQLASAGHDVITVVAGAQFGELDYRCFSINPENRQDYTTLVEDLHSRELNFDRVVHFWSLDRTDYCSFYSLLFLTQAIASSTTVEITLVTNGVYDILGEEELHPTTATVLGLAKVINQEYSQIACRHIDVMLPRSQLIGVLTELITPPTDFAVAYRGQHRWRQKYQLVEETNAIQLRSFGHYLIVGDVTQGLGRVFAEYLAKMPAKLAIVSDDIPTSWVDTLTAMGAEYFPVTVDITDESQMQRAIAQVEAQFGEIHGVFYSTPMSNQYSAAPIAELGQNECEYNFRTKVAGLCVLQKVLQDKNLDFCLLQSSLSAIIGGFGLGAYAAANTFIDAFAQHQSRRTSYPWLSVNWDAYDEAESIESSRALTSSEVWQATQQILAIDAVQVVVSKSPLAAKIEQSISVRERESQVENNNHNRPNLSSQYIAPRNEIEQAVAAIWQELLGIEIGINDNFFELGGHSLLAIQVIARLRTTFQVELPIRSLLFEAPTVAKIAEVIAGQQPQQMADLLAEIQSLSPAEIEQQLNARE